MSARAALPRLGEPLPVRTPHIEHVRLSCGLDLYTVQRRDLPIVDVQVVTRAGAAHDTPPCAGRAYLTADMLDEGTARRSATDIATAIEALGATIQTRATWDYAAATLHTLGTHLEAALDLLADIVLRPAFNDTEFARKQRERMHAIAQEQDDPHNRASAAFARLVYGADHPYGAPIGGLLHSVAALDPATLRSFYHDRYTPHTSFAVICGDVDIDAAASLMERAFAPWSAWSATPREADPLPPDPPARPRAIHLLDVPGAPQSELRLGHAGPGRGTDDYVPLSVGNTILGGAFTSRLNILLRERKGYTYGAGSSFAFRAGGGPFLVSTAVATAVTAAAVHDLVSELERLVRDGVSAAEVERARNYLVLGLPRMFETTGDVADRVRELALYDLPADYYERYVSAVRRVTPADVQSAVARWLRPAELVVVVAGDSAVVRGELEGLGMGVVHEYGGG